LNNEVNLLQGPPVSASTQIPLWKWSDQDRVERGSAYAPVQHEGKRARRIRFSIALIGLDVACILSAFLLLTGLRLGNPLATGGVELVAVLLPVYIMAAFNMNAYGTEVLAKPRKGIFRSVIALGMAVGLVLLVAFFIKASEDFSRVILVGGSVTSAMLLGLMRFTLGRATLRSIGPNVLEELIIADSLARPEWLPRGARFVEARECGIAPDLSDPMMLDRLGRLLANVDRVVVACRTDQRPLWAAMLKGANVQGELLAPELDEVGVVGLQRFGPYPTIRVSVGPFDLRSRVLKRALDLSVTLLVLGLLAPLMLMVASAIRFESRGPIFFAQRRLGRGNQLFEMLKFRSMYVETCDADGHCSTARDDIRVTGVGKFIRATSLDELPQLLNVLRGDMSLVGPRPHALGSLAGDLLFWEVDQSYWHRHSCKPGITGLAQVRGFRGATSHRDDLKNRLACDLEYLADWTIWRDVAILLRTVRVLMHRNAY
jgi:exopolysaccharide biosynthesis polyprenyl glycosylphosphotransferase